MTNEQAPSLDRESLQLGAGKNPQKFYPSFDPFRCPLDQVVSVEASAGTGKTWSISVLALRLLIEARLPIDQILIVTFTRAAAAELRDRIRARIDDVAQVCAAELTSEGDPFLQPLFARFNELEVSTVEIASRCQLALATFEQASVLTIHGFCQRVLTQFAFTAALPLSFKVNDGGQITSHRLARDAVNRILNRLKDRAELLQPVLNDLGQLDAGAKAVYRLLQDQPQLAEADYFLDGQRLNSFTDETSLTHVSNESEEALQLKIQRALDNLAAAHSAAALHWAQQRNGWQAMIRDIANRVEYGGKALHWRWASETEIVLNDYFSGNPTRSDFPEAINLLFKYLKTPKRKNEHAISTWLSQQPLLSMKFLLSANHELETIQSNIFQAELCRLIAQAPEQLAKQRELARQVSFSDLLWLTHCAMNPLPSSGFASRGAALRGFIRQAFPVAIIDEFQDTDELQYDIFSTLYVRRKTNSIHTHQTMGLFLVGDPKQAIYRFRHADLETYLRARDNAALHFSLSHNQRSTTALIQAVNGIFSQSDNPFQESRLPFQPAQKGVKPVLELIDGENRAALHLWELPTDPVFLPVTRLRRVVGQAIATEIVRLLGGKTKNGEIIIGFSQIQDDQLNRNTTERPTESLKPIQPRDIAVIVRTHAQAVLIKRYLQAANIGAIELGRDSIFDCPQMLDIEQLLAVLNAKQNGGLLRGLLSTPLFGWSAYDIAATATSESHQNRWVQVAMRISRYRMLIEQFGFARMWRELLRHEQVTKRLARIDLRALANYNQLGELLQSASVQTPSVAGLLRWLTQARVSQASREDLAASIDDGSGGLQLRLASDENLVRIVTIHKSKGLEYPIVFCPFLWESSARKRPSVVTVVRPLAAESAGIQVHLGALTEQAKSSEHVADDAEWVRLAYVALTRAINRCYLPFGFFAHNKPNELPTGNALTSELNRLMRRASEQSESTYATVKQCWLDYLSQQSSNVTLVQLSAAASTGVLQNPNTVVQRSARRMHRPLPRVVWSFSSFSGLHHLLETNSHSHAQAANDPLVERVIDNAEADRDAPTLIDLHPHEHSEIAQRGGETIEPNIIAADDIINFPRGEVAGHLIHHAFEHVTFADEATWQPAIEAAYQRFGNELPVTLNMLTAEDVAESETQLQSIHFRALRNMLRDVLLTPMPLIGCSLSTLQVVDVIREMGFTMTVKQQQLNTVVAWLRRAGLLESQATSETPAERRRVDWQDYLNGYLRGYMDMVCRVDGRYYVLDWKSNYLGEKCEQYGPASVEAAMLRGGYHLQRFIYLVALHRLLKNTLPGYSSEAHLGGSIYLFVRGVRPSWSIDGVQTGVFAKAAELSLVIQFDALLDGMSDE